MNFDRDALPPMDVAGRLGRLRDALAAGAADAGTDALLVGNLTNVRYLTGFTGSAALLLVTPSDTVFVTDGRLTSIPTPRAKRMVVLDWLAQDFEPGRRYSEAMVNLIIGKRHPDTAALRRYLVDEDLLSREAGEYWRSGGTTAP